MLRLVSFTIVFILKLVAAQNNNGFNNRNNGLNRFGNNFNNGLNNDGRLGSRIDGFNNINSNNNFGNNFNPFDQPVNPSGGLSSLQIASGNTLGLHTHRGRCPITRNQQNIDVQRVRDFIRITLAML